MEIKALIEKVRYLAGQPKNEVLAAPLYVGIARPWFARYLGYDLTDYFHDPQLCVKAQLLAKIFKHEEISDDSTITATIGVDYATALEASLFGVETVYRPGQEPSFGTPVLKSKSDLDRLELPDFYRSGLMPQVHQMYEEMREIVDGQLEVTFPSWPRGPWSVACMLRGFTEIYIDLLDDPGFIHRLMQFLVDAKIHYEKERAKFLGIEPKNVDERWKLVYADYRDVCPSDLYNDEVDGALFSADVYSEFIFPYEKQIADFYGGIRYYHSCGNLDNLIPQIAKLPGLKIMHIGAWTDLDKAIQHLPTGTTVQVVVHVQDDVMDTEPEHIRARINEIVHSCRDVPFMVCADTISSGSIDKVKDWIRITRETLTQADLPNMPVEMF
jgi:uroporphyrinogen-III decarboxylase